MIPIDREAIMIPEYEEIFRKESHHNHEIVMDDNNILRWKENRSVRLLLDFYDLNEIIRSLDYGKNDEEYRQLYRDMGYSLDKYWETFYWEANNEDANEYRK